MEKILRSRLNTDQLVKYDQIVTIKNYNKSKQILLWKTLQSGGP